MFEKILKLFVSLGLTTDEKSIDALKSFSDELIDKTKNSEMFEKTKLELEETVKKLEDANKNLSTYRDDFEKGISADAVDPAKKDEDNEEDLLTLLTGEENVKEQK